MKVLLVAVVAMLVVGAISGCASTAAYQASHNHYKFPGGPRWSGANS
jgi:hypothetical protein